MIEIKVGQLWQDMKRADKVRVIEIIAIVPNWSDAVVIAREVGTELKFRASLSTFNAKFEPRYSLVQDVS